MRRLKRLEATAPVETRLVQIGLVPIGRMLIDQMDVEQGQPVDIGGAYVNWYLYYPYHFKRNGVDPWLPR